MTIDKEQLKALAIAARTAGIENLTAAKRTKGRVGTDAGAALSQACTPGAILALLDEIEHLTESRQEARDLRNKMGDRLDAAEAENEALRIKAECVDDCAHLIRKLVHCRRQLATDESLAGKALDYLRRKGLQGSPLRAEAEAVEPVLDTPDELSELREQIGGLQAVGGMQAKALKALIFTARTSGGTAGPDQALMKACEEGERAISLGGVGQAYMAGADGVAGKEAGHD